MTALGKEMSRFYNLVIILVGVLLSAPMWAQEAGVEYAWVEKRDRNGIVIETSKYPGSPYKAVRGEMVVNASIAQLVALVSDLPRCPDWADLCKTSRLVRAISDNEQIVHIHNNIPFPVKDRDVVAVMRWSQDQRYRACQYVEPRGGGGAEFSLGGEK